LASFKSCNLKVWYAFSAQEIGGIVRIIADKCIGWNEEHQWQSSRWTDDKISKVLMNLDYNTYFRYLHNNLGLIELLSMKILRLMYKGV